MDIDVAAVARAFADTFLVYPPVVAAVVAYWLRHYTPLPVSAEVAARHHDETAAPLHLLVARLLRARPHALRLQGQVATLPTVESAQSCSLYMVHVLPPMDDLTLGVPDYYLFQIPGGEYIRAALATMAAEPHAYWANITTAGARGHIDADAFRHGDALMDAYFPDLWVAHVYDALLTSLLKTELTENALLVKAPQLVRALALPPALFRGCRPSDLMVALHEKMAACTDAQETARQVHFLRLRLDERAHAEYARRRAATPLPPTVPVAELFRRLLANGVY